MKILYPGSLPQFGTDRAVRDGLIKHGAEVESVSFTVFTKDYQLWDRIEGFFKRWIVLPFFSEPVDDPVMAARGFRYLARETFPQRILDAYNQDILKKLDEFRPDILFLYHYHMIYPETVAFAKSLGAKIFCFFPDDAFKSISYTKRARDVVRQLDCVITTKSFNIEELKQVGVPHVYFMTKGYIPDCHIPVTPTQADYNKYGGDVVFIGNGYEVQRLDFIADLAEALPDIKFTVYGKHWEKFTQPWFYYRLERIKKWRNAWKHVQLGTVICNEMSTIINTNKIVLGLATPGNRVWKQDLHTQRSVEIPACGGFMLAPYNAEIDSLFTEGKEAAYFRSFDDLVEKIRYYLAHEDERQRIAEAGHRKAVTDYSYYDHAKRIMDIYEEIKDA
ncbi:MAG: glycosyltransferase [Anaerolineaceae bacterium]|nr:glycosyltransferase [Anaerolineaceae bacterium]